jgi:hypothetical protein
VQRHLQEPHSADSAVAYLAARAVKSDGWEIGIGWAPDLESCGKEVVLNRVPILRLSLDRGDEASIIGSLGAAQGSRRKSVASSLVYTPHKQRGITRIDFGSDLV